MSSKDNRSKMAEQKQQVSQHDITLQDIAKMLPFKKPKFDFNWASPKHLLSKFQFQIYVTVVTQSMHSPLHCIYGFAYGFPSQW